VIGNGRPRIGFLGVGWIGRHRLEAIAASGAATVAMIADPSAEARAAAAAAVGGAPCGASLDDLLAARLDGVVIATPSGQHAREAVAALRHGLAVFCQKPLACTAGEASRVVRAAEAADRLLQVDFSYRHLAAAAALEAVVRSGALGEIYAVEAAFHNAYAPSQEWCRNRALAGGGCLLDLGVHLIDLTLGLLDYPRATRVAAALHAGGRPCRRGDDAVEDHAAAHVELEGGVALTLSCAWHAHAGRDCDIRLVLHGSRGGAALRNVGGSFYDFCAERYRGASVETLAAPPDDWGGRAAVAWARRLARDRGFDPGARRAVDVAAVLDRVYAA
jgi:predicted dehydrogenase